jgi:AcrR family transcriptional regulator
MPRKVVQEERKKQIFDALYQCLLEKSFKATSIKDIAREAKVNHGVLHYYFKSKEDLLVKFLDYIAERYRNDFQQWIDTKVSKDATEEAFIEEMFLFITNRITLNKHLSRIFVEIWEISLYDPLVKEKLQEIYRTMITVVYESFFRGMKDEKKARQLSLAIMAFFEGISLFAIFLPVPEELLLDSLSDFQTRFKKLLFQEFA